MVDIYLITYSCKNKPCLLLKKQGCASGGRGEIRTHGSFEASSVFKTDALNRSATLPLTMDFEFYRQRGIKANALLPIAENQTSLGPFSRLKA